MLPPAAPFPAKIRTVGDKAALHGRGCSPAGTKDQWRVAMLQLVSALPPCAFPPSHGNVPPPKEHPAPPAPPCPTVPPGVPADAAAEPPARGGREGAVVWVASGQGALRHLIPLCFPPPLPPPRPYSPKSAATNIGGRGCPPFSPPSCTPPEWADPGWSWQWSLSAYQCSGGGGEAPPPSGRQRSVGRSTSPPRPSQPCRDVSL